MQQSENHAMLTMGNCSGPCNPTNSSLNMLQNNSDAQCLCAASNPQPMHLHSWTNIAQITNMSLFVVSVKLSKHFIILGCLVNSVSFSSPSNDFTKITINVIIYQLFFKGQSHGLSQPVHLLVTFTSPFQPIHSYLPLVRPLTHSTNCTNSTIVDSSAEKV